MAEKNYLLVLFRGEFYLFPAGRLNRILLYLWTVYEGTEKACREETFNY